MITLICCNCGRKRLLDEEDDDEVHNACVEGWDFAFGIDIEILCPNCKDNQELHEAVSEY